MNLQARKTELKTCGFMLRGDITKTTDESLGEMTVTAKVRSSGNLDIH